MFLTDDKNSLLRLCWNKYESNLTESLQDLRSNSQLFDISLGCTEKINGKSRSIRAHKVVLSAWSNVFKDMLINHPNEINPFIFLKDVPFDELSTIIDFMYQGEVNVLQGNLNEFLLIADQLQIKGLSQAANGLNL